MDKKSFLLALQLAKKGGGGGGTTNHDELVNRNIDNQHSMNAITGLLEALSSKQNNLLSLDEEMPYMQSFVNDEEKIFKKDETVNDDIVLFDSNGDIKDSGKKLSEYIPYADTHAMEHLLENVPVDDNEIIAIRFDGNKPDTSSSSGFKGQIVIDANYLYICIGDNNWKKIELLEV